MSGESKEKVQKKKTPTALKRDVQNVKKQGCNKAFKARVRTALNRFEKAVKESRSDVQELLNRVYSMMDKGVKRGVYKSNKASRTKSRMSARLAKSG